MALIRSGELPVGERMSEASLAQRLGVSRTPVREALSGLDTQGLVVSQGRGVSLRVPTAAELVDALDMRMALEGFAVSRAAQRQREGLLMPVRIRAAEALSVECDAQTRTGGPQAGAEANRRFHLALAALADNQKLNEQLEVLWDQFLIATRAGLTTVNRVHDVHAEHQQILRALTLGDATQARSAVEGHIAATIESIQQEQP